MMSLDKKTIYEIFRACRLCGGGGGYKMPIIPTVKAVRNTEVDLTQKIQECIRIEVNQNDKMPPLICEVCVNKVNDFFEFLEMCRDTNRQTRLRLGLPIQNPVPEYQSQEAGDCILGMTEPVYSELAVRTKPDRITENDVRVQSLKKDLEKLIRQEHLTIKSVATLSKPALDKRETVSLKQPIYNNALDNKSPSLVRTTVDFHTNGVTLKPWFSFRDCLSLDLMMSIQGVNGGDPNCHTHPTDQISILRDNTSNKFIKPGNSSLRKNVEALVLEEDDVVKSFMPNKKKHRDKTSRAFRQETPEISNVTTKIGNMSVVERVSPYNVQIIGSKSVEMQPKDKLDTKKGRGKPQEANKKNQAEVTSPSSHISAYQKSHPELQITRTREQDRTKTNINLLKAAIENNLVEVVTNNDDDVVTKPTRRKRLRGQVQPNYNEDYDDDSEVGATAEKRIKITIKLPKKPPSPEPEPPPPLPPTPAPVYRPGPKSKKLMMQQATNTQQLIEEKAPKILTNLMAVPVTATTSEPTSKGASTVCDICSVKCKTVQAKMNHMKKHTIPAPALKLQMPPRSPSPPSPPKEVPISKPGPKSKKMQNNVPVAPAPTLAEPLPAPKQHECGVCGHNFKSNTAKITHQKTHLVTFTPPSLSCNPCGEWYPTAAEIEKHHKMHETRRKPYKCRGCTEKFKKLKDYDAHMVQKRCVPYEELPDIVCPDCSNVYQTQNLFTEHRKICLPQIRCKHCSKVFANASHLKMHLHYCKVFKEEQNKLMETSQKTTPKLITKAALKETPKIKGSPKESPKNSGKVLRGTAKETPKAEVKESLRSAKELSAEPAESPSLRESLRGSTKEIRASIKDSPKSLKVTLKGKKETPMGQKETPKSLKETPKVQKETPKGQKETPKGQKETPKGQKDTPVVVSKPKIAPNVRRRLKNLQIRMRRCDGVLKKLKNRRYDVARVKDGFDLDTRCTYPYRPVIKTKLKVKRKPLPVDKMVIFDADIQKELYVEEDYVHWDSDNSDSSDEEYSVLKNEKVKRMPSLTNLALKTLFSRRCIGKVPRKLRRVKPKFDVFNDFDNDTAQSDFNNLIQSLDDSVVQSEVKYNNKNNVNDVLTGNEWGNNDVDNIVTNNKLNFNVDSLLKDIISADVNTNDSGLDSVEPDSATKSEFVNLMDVDTNFNTISNENDEEINANNEDDSASVTSQEIDIASFLQPDVDVNDNGSNLVTTNPMDSNAETNKVNRDFPNENFNVDATDVNGSSNMFLSEDQGKLDDKASNSSIKLTDGNETSNHVNGNTDAEDFIDSDKLLEELDAHIGEKGSEDTSYDVSEKDISLDDYDSTKNFSMDFP